MNDSSIRDGLALARTHLANERTFLAYIRTSLSLLASGAIILQFFSQQVYASTIAWSLMILGGATLALGISRFLQFKKRLNTSNLKR